MVGVVCRVCVVGVVCVNEKDRLLVCGSQDNGQLASIIINTVILVASSLKRSVSSTISLFRISSTMSSRVTTPAQQGTKGKRRT